MGDNHKFDPFTAQLCCEIEHFRCVLRVQCRGGFIEQQQFRARSHRTGDGGTLLLSAGEFGGMLIGMFGKTEMRQKLKSPSISRLLCPSVYLPQHQGDIFLSRQVLKQIALLKNVAERSSESDAFALRLRHEAAVHSDGSGRCRQQSAQHAQEG